MDGKDSRMSASRRIISNYNPPSNPVEQMMKEIDRVIRAYASRQRSEVRMIRPSHLQKCKENFT